jgi:APA family basic amino acid/polyamine antiporter
MSTGGGEETLGHDDSRHPRDRLPRVLSLWDAAMLIVASVIGAGIFFTPGEVARLVSAPGLILLAWLAGALISLAGALSNAELGAMFPRAGGDYVYLREGLHPAAGFLVGWLSFFAIYAGTIAALAIVVGEAGARSLGWGRGGGIAIASLVILVCSLLHGRSVVWGARANNLTSLAKLAGLSAFVLLGPIFGDGSFDAWLSWTAPEVESSGRVAGAGGSWLRFGQALSPVLFSYLGASEIRDPERNLPRARFLGLAFCAGLHAGVNAVYLYALPPAELAAAGDVGEAAAKALFGPVGGLWVGAFVMVSVLGTLNATVLVGPRIVYAMALDGYFFAGVDRVHAGFRTPAAAVAVQALVAIGLVVFLGSFPKALDFTVFAIVLATSADVVALFALRRRQPDRPRPYRAWGYPWVPLLYLAVNAAIGTALVVASPRECATTFVLLAAGLLLYRAFDRRL